MLTWRTLWAIQVSIFNSQLNMWAWRDRSGSRGYFNDNWVHKSGWDCSERVKIKATLGSLTLQGSREANSAKEVLQTPSSPDFLQIQILRGTGFSPQEKPPLSSNPVCLSFLNPGYYDQALVWHNGFRAKRGYPRGPALHCYLVVATLCHTLYQFPSLQQGELDFVSCFFPKVVTTDTRRMESAEWQLRKWCRLSSFLGTYPNPSAPLGACTCSHYLVAVSARLAWWERKQGDFNA